jgi:hypothetical protein
VISSLVLKPKATISGLIRSSEPTSIKNMFFLCYILGPRRETKVCQNDLYPGQRPHIHGR